MRIKIPRVTFFASQVPKTLFQVILQFFFWDFQLRKKKVKINIYTLLVKKSLYKDNRATGFKIDDGFFKVSFVLLTHALFF